MYCIFVTINVKPEFLEQFMEASLGDARGSVRDEPECFRFDINQNAEIPTRFHLYEVYRNEEALEAHKVSPHFKKWFATVESWFDGPFERVTMQTVFPSSEGWKKQKPALLNW